jgi:hypothetical protein
MNVLQIDPGCTGYPEHDHVKDEQEEVYVVLRGGGTMDAGGEKMTLGPGTFIRVGRRRSEKSCPDRMASPCWRSGQRLARLTSARDEQGH